MNAKISVVIPTYKEVTKLQDYERALIDRVSKVFKEYTLYFVLPERLLSEYKSFENFKIISFKDWYFTDKNTYSKLLTSINFYEHFSDFDYMQIIQLDCWVFENRLSYFTNLSYDYIGAPWMLNGFEGKPKKQLWKVGNGGFSLRKIATFIKILNTIKCKPVGKLPVFKEFNNNIFQWFKNKGFRNNLRHYLKKAPGEDIFWSIYIPNIFCNDEFKISDPITASFYSYEVFPEFLYNEITNRQLPMGCHNWMNNDSSFWKKYIQI